MNAFDSHEVLAAVGVSKTYPGVRALDNVTLRLHRGEFIGLLGENGAGKSTLLKILTGVEVPDAGALYVGGEKVALCSTRDAAAHGISAIFQELSLLPNLTIAENIFLGREPTTRCGTIDYPAMNEAARQHLARLQFDLDPRRLVAHLRLGQQQVVELACAISKQARVIVMDEPTSALSVQEIAVLRSLALALKRDGVAILYITHKLDELDGLADGVVIMRDGRLVAEGKWGEYSAADIVRLMVGRESGFARTRPKPPQPEEVLAVEAKGVRVKLARGEVLGLFGLMGAGRTELLETIFGLHASKAGVPMRVHGVPVTIRRPADAIAAGIAMAPENRKEDGLVPDMSARANASLASLRAATRWGLLSAKREHDHVIRFLERFRMRGGGSLDVPVRNFSGGNQQKVILARWLATQPIVLLLDEPTRGIDVNAKQEIYELICELAAGGLAVILASSELPEVLALSHRIIVMREGSQAAELTAAEATPELIMQHALPLRASGDRP
jgi:ribose transport system ATP-binding protein